MRYCFGPLIQRELQEFREECVTLALKCIIAFGCTADEEVFIQV